MPNKLYWEEKYNRTWTVLKLFSFHDEQVLKRFKKKGLTNVYAFFFL